MAQKKAALTSIAGMTDAEWQVRVDLAMAYRLASHFGWSTFIYNHVTARVPGQPGRFLIKRHDELFSEVKASTLAMLELSGEAAPGYEDVNVAGFNIHAGILRARRDVNAVMHLHTVSGVAVAAHSAGLLPLCQTAMRFYQRISYHDYEGLSEDTAECDRLAASLGRNKAMILRNHGLLVCGDSVAQAVYIMGQLIHSCDVQCQVLGMQGAPVLPPPEVCEHSAQQWEAFDRTGARAHVPAWQRILDRIDPSYRE